MDRENAGGRCLRRSVRRHIEQAAHGVALGALEADVVDPDAAGGLGEMSQHAAGQDQNHSPSRQGPSAAHVSLPVPTAFDSAFGLVLFVIDTVSEGRLRASASGAKHAFEVWTQNQDRPLSRLYCLRNAAALTIECGPQLQVLNQVLRNLIQNLETLNQKVK